MINKIKLNNLLVNKYFLITLLTFIGLIIRLIHINTPQGLWYDEMITYIFASRKFPTGIIDTILREEYHMPLYYFFLSLWMKAFGSQDTVLRLSSVIWGVLTIPAMFFLGEEFKSKKLGYLASTITCLSPLLVYYSQEFRLYSMITFFSTLSLLFFLKTLRQTNAKNLSIFHCVNLVLMYIYTMSMAFVFIEFVIIATYLYKLNKIALKNFIKSTFIFLILSIPYFLLFANYYLAAKNVFIDPLSWGHSDLTTIPLLLNDWFSPFLTCVYGHNLQKYNLLFLTFKDFIFNTFLLTSILCFIIGFANGVKKSDLRSKFLLVILFSFLGLETILSCTGHFVMMSRYTLIIFPIILIISIDGILQIKTKLIKQTLLSLIILIFLYSSIIKAAINPMYRVDGLKPPSEILDSQLNKNDYIIATERTELFKKYTKNINYIEFDSHRIILLDKTKQENLKIFDKIFVKSTNINNSTRNLLPYFLNSEPTQQLQTFIDQNINNIPKGQKLIHIEGPNYFGNLTNEDIISKTLAFSTGNLSQYEFKNELFHIFNEKINLDLQKALNKNQSLTKIKTIDKTYTNKFINCSWRMTIYKKI